MSIATRARHFIEDIAVAFQFMTRIPLPAIHFDPNGLARATKFFPLVGLVVGGSAAWLHQLLLAHLPRPVAAILVLTYLVLITGCFHEDGLADTADAFGGGWNKEQILIILKDSRVGSYGATALVLSLVARCILLIQLPPGRFAAYVICAHVLCRWSSLVLSYAMPTASTPDSQGARVAKLTSLSSLIFGSVFSIAIAAFALGWRAIAPLLITLVISAASGWFYSRKIGGVTGDCFGATNQLTEIAVYICGVWNT